MVDGGLEAVRRAYAEKVRGLAGPSSAALARAFAAVPRERFVGPGPWQLLSIDALAQGYRTTDDDDPRHLYDNVLVALDASRWLNNGEPAALARFLAALELGPGLRFLHVGCGTGYYTAIAAEVVGAGGRVVAVEIDPDLARQARRNLEPWSWVEVVHGDGSLGGGAAEDADAILVNAGATEVASGWLARLRDGGRLLVPLTVASPVAGSGFGGMLLVVREPGGYAARLLSPVAIFHCAGARSEASEARLREALERGGFEDVRSLRVDPHEPGDACWLHGREACLSLAAPPSA
jgi:protein-L-isoaspartate(D-aspartate) O-methyltransferase